MLCAITIIYSFSLIPKGNNGIIDEIVNDERNRHRPQSMAGLFSINGEISPGCKKFITKLENQFLGCETIRRIIRTLRNHTSTKPTKRL